MHCRDPDRFFGMFGLFSRRLHPWDSKKEKIMTLGQVIIVIGQLTLDIRGSRSNTRQGPSPHGGSRRLVHSQSP